MIQQSGMAGFFRAKLFFGFVLALLPQVAVAQSANDGYDPNANDFVQVLIVAANGQPLVGGSFTSIDGQMRNRIPRLNADGSLDAGSGLLGNNAVNALHV